MCVFGIFNINTAIISVEGTVTRHTGWSDTVKGVTTIFGAHKQIDWLLSHTKKVAWLIFWQNTIYYLKHFGHTVCSENATNTKTVDCF